MTRWPRCALASLAGLALFACGGNEVAVSIEMTLDPDSCSAVSDPGAVTLSCVSTAGLWLRAPSGEVRERGCIDVPAGSTLAALPRRLADIDLSTSSADGVSVDVALYGLWDASSGCPAPDELDGQAAPPEVIVSGSSGPVDLSGSSGPVEVELACDAITAGSSPPCEQECADGFVECLDDSVVEQCDLDFEQCEKGCGPANDKCDDACADGFVDCLLAAPEGTCASDLGACLQGCPPDDDACQADCEGFHLDCLDVECEQQADECEAGCATGGDGCATVL